MVIKKCLLILLLAGCASQPYIEVSMAYPLDYYTDWYLQTERSWPCSNRPKTIIEIGVEKENLRIGLHHESWLLCGGPFYDGKRELYFNDIRITKKWGGNAR